MKHSVTAVWFMVACLSASCTPNRVDEANARGQEAFERGDPVEALAHFDEAIALDPDNATAYLGRGMAHWWLNQHEQALPELTRAIKLDPDLIWAYFYRGGSLISLHRYEAGLEDFAVVTASDALPTEDLIRAYRWHSIALLNLERYEEAVEDFTRCIELQPEMPFHYVERGRVYEVLGKRAEARADYEHFLRLNSEEDELSKEVRQRLAALEGTAAE